MCTAYPRVFPTCTVVPLDIGTHVMSGFFFSFLSGAQHTYQDYIIRTKNCTETRARVCTSEITFRYSRRGTESWGKRPKMLYLSASRADNARAAHVATVLLIASRRPNAFTRYESANFAEPVRVPDSRPRFLFGEGEGLRRHFYSYRKRFK